MTEDDRKLLTEYLGEEWRTIENSWGDDFPCSNRTFNTWQDLGDLKEKMVEKGDWYDFTEEFSDIFRETNMSFCDYILNPARFCQLVAGWKKEKL